MSYLDNLYSTLVEDLQKLEHALIHASEVAAKAETEHDPENPHRVRAEAECAAALSDRHAKHSELSEFLVEHPDYHAEI